MTAKQLKEWVQTVPDESIVEIDHYRWESVKAEKIRAIYISSPQRTMNDVCNVEEVSS